MTDMAFEQEVADPPPSALLALTELPRALAEMAWLHLSSPTLAMAPRGDGHPVLVLPGFTGSDSSTEVLRRFLTSLGYDARPWRLGRNHGPKTVGEDGEKLISLIRELHGETGRKVSLVGQSLGGVMARSVSRSAPDAVRQVISLGSPFTGSPLSTNVWRAYQSVTGETLDDPRIWDELRKSAVPPPVPSTAIWSREDGITSWRNCVEQRCETTDNIEVHGSHCGMGVNPTVLYAIADRLAQPEDDWRPFNRCAAMAMFYPTVGHA